MFRRFLLSAALLVAPALASAGTLFPSSSITTPTVTSVDNATVSNSWVSYDMYNPDFAVLDDATIDIKLNGTLVRFYQDTNLTKTQLGYDVWYGTTGGSRFKKNFGSAYLVSNGTKLFGSITYAGEGFEIYPVGTGTGGLYDVVIAKVLALESDGSGGICEESTTDACDTVSKEDSTAPAEKINNTIRVGVIIGADAVRQVKMTLSNGNTVLVSVIPYVIGSITRATDIAHTSGAIGTAPTFDLVGFDTSTYSDAAGSVQGNYLDLVSLSTTTGLMGLQHTKRAQWNADVMLLWVDQKSGGQCDFAQTYSGISPQWSDRAFGVASSNRGCEILDMAPARTLTRLVAARQGAELPHVDTVHANRWLGSYVDGTLTRMGDISAPTNSIYYAGNNRRVELLSNCTATEFNCAATQVVTGGVLTYSTENAVVAGNAWNDVANYYELCHVADPTRCP